MRLDKGSKELIKYGEENTGHKRKHTLKGKTNNLEQSSSYLSHATETWKISAGEISTK